MVCYNGSGDKLRRHNRVLNAIQAALLRLGIASTQQQLLTYARRVLADGSPDPNDTTQKQPDLAIFDPHFGGPETTLLDLVHSDPSAPAYNTSAARNTGSTANRAERIKDRKYGQQALAAGYRFRAFGVEIFGCWGASATKLLEEWSAYAHENDLFDTQALEGWSAANFPDMCRQYISVALQRSNALYMYMCTGTDQRLTSAGHQLTSADSS